MASTTWILSFCMLLSAVPFSTGDRKVVRKPIARTAPDIKDDVNDECSCSSITYKLGKLNERATSTSRQISGLELNLNNLKFEIQSAENGTTRVSELIATLYESQDNLLVGLGEQKAVEREIEVQISGLRQDESVLGSNIDDVRYSQQDTADKLQTLKETNTNFEKKIREYTRIDRAQLDAIASLTRTDGSIADYISSLVNADTDHEQRASSLRNESSSLASQLDELEANDNRFKANADDLSAQQAGLRTRVTESKTIDTNIDRRFSDIEATGRNLQEDAAQTEHATEAKAGELNEISETYSGLEAESKRLETSDEYIDGKVEAFQSKDGEFLARLEKLEAQGLTYQQQIDALQETNTVHQAKIESLRKTDTVQRMDISDLNINDQFIREQISEINSNISAFASGLSVIGTQQQDIIDFMDSITNRLLVVENQVETTQIITESKSTATLVLSSCTRNMPHDKARAAMVLDGEHSAICDTVTDGGGYTVFASRTIGNEDFNRPWADYKKGFGNPSTGDFFIGLDALYKLAQGRNELRIDMLDKNGKPYSATYNFGIDNEASKYRLHVSDFRGSAGDSLNYNDGSQFSTYDQDNDESRSNCARDRGGAFWFKECQGSNLFGRWGVDGENGVIWTTISSTESLSFFEMKIR